jgi:hypothetical protein
MEYVFSLLSGLFIPAVIVGFFVVRALKSFKAGPKRAKRYTDVAGQDGHAIEKTALAKLGLGRLNVDAAVVASAGTKRAAPMTIDDHILRPTVGVRAISLALTAALGFVIAFGTPEILADAGNLMKYLLGASVVYAVAFIQTYELRYNRDRLIAPGRAFNRREQKWRDLKRIQDNGHYLFVLTFADGSKLEVQKHLVGMADFLTFAQAQIAANSDTAQTPKTTMRAGGNVFGSRKTFS